MSFTGEDTQKAKKPREKSPAPLVIREMKMEVSMAYHHTPTKPAKIKFTENTKCW